ncbi:MAG TPA: hypothetical protein VME66_04210 [Candidatus Acidoferrales bacterium]|nr:hypothetical protein [Candidatus Acidoferrales bacterium]
MPVDEKVEAQPLVVRAVPTLGGTKDLIIAATMNNRVFAFNLVDGKLVWKSAQLAVPLADDKSFDIWATNTSWGILSTPAIDRSTYEMYLVTWGLESEKPVYRLRVLDIRNGEEETLGTGAQSSKGIIISGTVNYTGRDGTPRTLSFDPARQKQRPALLLQGVKTQSGIRHVVFVAFGALGEKLDSSGDPSRNSHGWVIAYDADDLHHKGAGATGAVWCTTPRGGDGGIWQAGSGVAGDPDGNVYALTGNGTFDGVTDYSESFLRLRYSRSVAGVGRLQLVDWFVAFRDAQRAQDPDHQDRDLGSAGPIVIRDLGVVVGGGKDGILYATRLSNFGHEDPSSLAEPPFVAAYAPAKGTDPVKDLDAPSPDGLSHHIHGAPVYWRADGVGALLYVWGENEMLRAFKYDGTRFALVASAPQSQRASRLMPAPGGMPGGFISLSANGSDPTSGIVWATAPTTGDANKGQDSTDGRTTFTTPTHTVAGTLRAYDAVHFDVLPDHSRQLRLLWDSDRRPGDAYGAFAKFTPPTIANGRVIVPTFGNKLVVYGLAGND